MTHSCCGSHAILGVFFILIYLSTAIGLTPGGTVCWWPEWMPETVVTIVNYWWHCCMTIYWINMEITFYCRLQKNIRHNSNYCATFVIDVEYSYGFVWWGVCKQSRWRHSVTVPSEDGGYVLLWQRYDNNEMAETCSVHDCLWQSMTVLLKM